MPIYQLLSDTWKSSVQIVSDERVPQNVQYMKYQGMMFERDPDFQKEEVDEPERNLHWKELPRGAVPKEGALCVDGRDLIAKTPIKTFDKDIGEIVETPRTANITDVTNGAVMGTVRDGAHAAVETDEEDDLNQDDE